MFKESNTSHNPNDQSEKLSQYTLLGSNQSHSARRQSFMSEPPTGIGIENFNINTGDFHLNRRMDKNSFNSSTNNGNSAETFYHQNPTFHYNGSDKTKRKSISQSPRSNISFDNKVHEQNNSKKLDEISKRVASLENTVNQLITLVAKKNKIKLGTANSELTKFDEANNSNVEISNPEDIDEDMDFYEEEEGLSPITTTVKNPVTQEAKLFKLNPKKIVKKRNKSKTNSATGSYMRLDKLPTMDQDMNKSSIPNMLDPNVNGYNNSINGSFFSNFPLLETNNRKRNSSLGLPLPLNTGSTSMFNSISNQQPFANSQSDKRFRHQVPPMSISAIGPSQQMTAEKDQHKPSIMMPSVTGSFALPIFSPKGAMPGSIDSFSSARTSFDDKQLQMYQQLQKINQQHLQNTQLQHGKHTNVKHDSMLLPSMNSLDSAGSSQSPAVASDASSMKKSITSPGKRIIDIEKSNSDSDESVHVLSQTPDVSQLLNNTGRLKPHVVSKLNPKVKPKFQYSINRAPSNIEQVWREYRYGIDNKPPLMELDQKFGNFWLESKSRKTYSRRKVIYEYILRGINEGFPEDKLIEQLEDLRSYTTGGGKSGRKGVGWIQDRLINVHTALGYAKLDNIVRSGFLKHIIHNEEKMKELLSNDSFNDVS
ncbi:hypothetical protein QEN19_000343 [Hanseniaspora menglaensis]